MPQRWGSFNRVLSYVVRCGGLNSADIKKEVRCVTRAHLVEELFPCGVGLDGKLQLCIHGGDPDVDLENKHSKKLNLLHYYFLKQKPLNKTPCNSKWETECLSVLGWIVFRSSNNLPENYRIPTEINDSLLCNFSICVNHNPNLVKTL